MTKEISNHDDIIDSRDVIARIEELTGERSALVDAMAEAQTDVTMASHGDGDTTGELATILQAATVALVAWDASEEAEELKSLQALASEAEGYAADWHHGEALIRDSHFTAYAEELANDTGMVPDDLTWPLNCIDWEEAARQLKQDYTEVDFAGVAYWIR